MGHDLSTDFTPLHEDHTLYTFLGLWRFELSVVLGMNLVCIYPDRPDIMTAGVRMPVGTHRSDTFLFAENRMHTISKFFCLIPKK